MQERVSRMLDAVAADACSGMQPLAEALVSESEACQRAAIMIASLTTSWTSWTDDQAEELTEAGCIDGLVRQASMICDIVILP